MKGTPCVVASRLNTNIRPKVKPTKKSMAKAAGSALLASRTAGIACCSAAGMAMGCLKNESLGLLLRGLVFPDPVQDFLQTQYVAVFLPDVEKIGEVRRFRPIAYTFFRHDAAIPVLQGVDAGGADAAARRTAGDDERIDAHARQRCLQMRAEKAGGIFLDHRDVLRILSQARVDLDPFAAELEPAQGRNFFPPYAGVLEVIFIAAGGEKNRNLLLVGRRDQLFAGFDHAVQVAAQRTSRIGKPQLQVDDDNGRFLAEAHPAAQAVLLVKLAISLKSIFAHNAPRYLFR